MIAVKGLVKDFGSFQALKGLDIFLTKCTELDALRLAGGSAKAHAVGCSIFISSPDRDNCIHDIHDGVGFVRA